MTNELSAPTPRGKTWPTIAGNTVKTVLAFNESTVWEHFFAVPALFMRRRILRVFDSAFMMMADVFRAIHNLQILYAVIQFIFINVMNDLIRKQLTLKMLFHYRAVFAQWTRSVLTNSAVTAIMDIAHAIRCLFKHVRVSVLTPAMVVSYAVTARKVWIVAASNSATSTQSASSVFHRLSLSLFRDCVNGY